MNVEEHNEYEAEKDYQGRGKQSLLIEDAVKYYLFTISNLKWTEYERTRIIQN